MLDAQDIDFIRRKTSVEKAESRVLSSKGVMLQKEKQSDTEVRITDLEVCKTDLGFLQYIFNSKSINLLNI